MQRKIIHLGTDTFVVSLPSVWVKHHKLKKGDNLEVEEAGPKLVVYPSSESKGSKIVVDVSGTRPMIKRILGALYKAGYDEFEVRFETDEEFKSIKEVMGEFIGFEITESGRKSAIVRNISHIITDEFGSIQRKMLFVILTMADDALAAAKSRDWERLQLLAAMDADVNRYADFCRRILNTAGHRVVNRVPPSYYIVEQLERIGDSYRDICLYIGQKRFQVSKNLAEFYVKTTIFLREFQKVYYDFDTVKLTDFAKMHYELLNEFNALLQSSGKTELPVLVLLRVAEGDMFDMNGALIAEKL